MYPWQEVGDAGAGMADQFDLRQGQRAAFDCAQLHRIGDQQYKVGYRIGGAGLPEQMKKISAQKDHRSHQFIEVSLSPGELGETVLNGTFGKRRYVGGRGRQSVSQKKAE